MELKEISSLAKVKAKQKVDATLSSPPIQDTVALSTEAIEAEKRAYFVSLLKEMPSPTSVEKAIAKKIYTELL